jgi:hypothetical protein
VITLDWAYIPPPSSPALLPCRLRPVREQGDAVEAGPAAEVVGAVSADRHVLGGQHAALLGVQPAAVFGVVLGDRDSVESHDGAEAGQAAAPAGVPAGEGDPAQAQLRAGLNAHDVARALGVEAREPRAAEALDAEPRRAHPELPGVRAVTQAQGARLV